MSVAVRLREARLEIQVTENKLRTLRTAFEREVEGAVRARLTGVDELTRKHKTSETELKASERQRKYWRSAALSLQAQVRELVESNADLTACVAIHEQKAAATAATLAAEASKREREQRARHLDIKRDAAKQSEEYLESECKVRKLELELRKLQAAEVDAQRRAKEAQTACTDMRAEAIREAEATAEASQARSDAEQAQALAERREAHAKAKAEKLRDRVDELAAPTTQDRSPEEWRALKDEARRQAQVRERRYFRGVISSHARQPADIAVVLQETQLLERIMFGTKEGFSLYFDRVPGREAGEEYGEGAFRH